MRYDCIQVSTLPDFLVFATVIPKALGAKVILDLHEPTPELWVTKYGLNRLCWLCKLQTKIEQLGIRYADWALTVTPSLRRRFGKRGANIHRITVVPNVCEEEAFNYYPDAPRYDYSSRFTLITHGLIEERYGHEEIIRAASGLVHELPDLSFEILGEGEHRPALDALVRELHCDDRVHFRGFVPQDELLKKIRWADVGIVAMRRSPYSELIDTNKMWEYVALRKPVIVSRLAGVEETFDSSSVMFFEAGSAQDLAKSIEKLYHDSALRQELAENAYSLYTDFRANNFQ